MRFLDIVLPLVILWIPNCYAQGGQFCISSAQCSSGYSCVKATSGLMTCQPNSSPSPQGTKYCQYDFQCTAPFTRCVRYGWYSVCEQIRQPPYVPDTNYPPKGNRAIDEPCTSDIDCAEYLQCTNKDGSMSCQLSPGFFPFKECTVDSDCGFIDECAYDNRYKKKVCHTVQIPTTAFPDITGTPPPYPRPCSADYQCRPGESCSGQSLLDSRFCVSDPNNPNRLCRFNADCINGQQCKQNVQGRYVCTVLPDYGLRACNYDFECFAGQKCVNTGTFWQSDFRCRTQNNSGFSKCRSDYDCVPSQICVQRGKSRACVSPVNTGPFAGPQGPQGGPPSGSQK